MASTNASLLRLPIEIRLKVYNHLFVTPQVLRVEAEYPARYHADDDEDDASWNMRHIVNLSAQLLWTCRQIHSEAVNLLYESNTFDCSQREGMKLLLKTIGPNPFSTLQSLILDWDQLLDLRFSLAKPTFVHLTSNLLLLTLSTWRTRMLFPHRPTADDISFIFHDAKSYERQLVQSAVEICQKSTKLKFVVERLYGSPSSSTASKLTVAAAATVAAIADEMQSTTESTKSGTEGESSSSASTTASTTNPRPPTGGAVLEGSMGFRIRTKASTQRVKWRFLADEAQMFPDESKVDLDGELMALNINSVNWNQERGSIGALDPI